MAPPSSVPDQEKKVQAYNKLAAQLCTTKWQIYYSAIGAAFTCYFHMFVTAGRKLPFEDASAFQAFLFGVGGVCAIIAPLTFTLLIQQGQRAHNEKFELFRRYQDLVIELRQYLKQLYDEKHISNYYIEFLSSLEMTRSSDLDGPPEAYYWWQWAAAGLIRALEDEAASDQTDIDFDEVQYGLIPRLYVIEELLNSLQVNAIRRAVINIVLTRPVIQLFTIVALVLVLAVLSVVHYNKDVSYIYFFSSLLLTNFMIFSIFQLGRYALYEAREVMSEGREG